MLKNIFIFFLIFLFKAFFSFSLADDVNFKNYSDINNCIPFSNDLDKYAANIEKCFKKYNKKFSDEFYSTLDEALPESFFRWVNFGDEVNQYIKKEFVHSDHEINIEN